MALTGVGGVSPGEEGGGRRAEVGGRRFLVKLLDAIAHIDVPCENLAFLWTRRVQQSAARRAELQRWGGRASTHLDAFADISKEKRDDFAVRRWRGVEGTWQL